MSDRPKKQRKRPPCAGRPTARSGARKPVGWCNRIVGKVDVDPRTLTGPPDNWRAHPLGQAAAREERAERKRASHAEAATADAG